MNWKSFWLPMMGEFFIAIVTVIGTVIGVHYLYYVSENLHKEFDCVYYRNFYSMQCYMIKQCRSYLESLTYNIVYTTICGVGLALANFVSRAKGISSRALAKL